jgi:hypothetical protein
MAYGYDMIMRSIKSRHGWVRNNNDGNDYDDDEDDDMTSCFSYER